MTTSELLVSFVGELEGVGVGGPWVGGFFFSVSFTFLFMGY